MAVWKPESSHLESVEDGPGSLRVKFRSSPRVYEYLTGDRTQDILRAWKEFPSPGTYHHRFVRPFPLAKEPKGE